MAMKPGGPPLPMSLPGRLSRDRRIINLQQRAARRQSTQGPMPAPPPPAPPSSGGSAPMSLPGRLARDRGIINLQQRAARRQPDRGGMPQPPASQINPQQPNVMGFPTPGGGTGVALPGRGPQPGTDPLSRLTPEQRREAGIAATAQGRPSFGPDGRIIGREPMQGPLGSPGTPSMGGPTPIRMDTSQLTPEQRAAADAFRETAMRPRTVSSVNTTTDRDMMGRAGVGRSLGGALGQLGMGMPAGSPAFKKGGVVKAKPKAAAPVKKKAGGMIAKPKTAAPKAKGKAMPAFKKGGAVKKKGKR